MERNNIKLREKRFLTCSWRGKCDNSNGFLLAQIEGFKVGGICRCPNEVTIADTRQKERIIFGFQGDRREVSCRFIPQQLFQMIMMYSFHERFPGIIIPRNLCSCTRAIEVLFMKVFNSEELICLRRGWNMMNLNLSG